ncbi:MULTISPECIES: DUF2956 domain-containing protein [unclassified Vibrio]|uniref:DUF2956 domain-containing protein n=1 Tax=unclassified Vibrio TaxID=2614977 RepID=UPI001360E7D3|nr:MULTISPECIES: DUF2956 domain-containing protein [unclassified Vibrio]NAW59396.1 DUF2956 family protein [Vibrio sp. V36_P2S2PM302]NAX24939.1 DUF2956 family protein [Vibrio sp. V38_P2S17PM301]NAX29666.1 DUF2956 family protein [Vibrio sp. V37_P2S8PM304]
MTNRITPSPQSQQEAMTIAKATQKPGQTKEQTKLIAQGIEKGIALYKKQQKDKSRQADKAKKKAQRDKQKAAESVTSEAASESPNAPSSNLASHLPWVLLAVSWAGFIAFVSLN